MRGNLRFTGRKYKVKDEKVYEIEMYILKEVFIGVLNNSWDNLPAATMYDQLLVHVVAMTCDITRRIRKA